MTTEVSGDLVVKVVRGIDLQNLAVFGTCNPYVLVKLKSSLDSLTTAVKDCDANPSWQETFTFRNASSTDGLQICLMEKEGPREGVVSVGNFIPSSAWGYPGVGGADHVTEIKMPGNSKPETEHMGTIILKLQYHVELKFRSPLMKLKIPVAKTGALTKMAKIDVVVDKALDLIYKPVALVESVGGRMTKNQKLASGGAAAVVGGGVSITLMALAVPVVFMAVLFLPLTLLGGFLLAAVALMLLPFALAVGWLIFCSRPVQCRVWMPWLFWSVCRFPLVNKALLQPPPPGTEQ